MEFEWDPNKAFANERKHGVTLQEAATVFGDPLAITFEDPDHSKGENRYITFGLSIKKRLLVVSHTEQGSSARVSWIGKRGYFMRKAKESNELRPHYRREDLGQGVRGKYFATYQKGTNLVLLSPDVAKVFSSEEAVNEALRSLINVAQKSTALTRRSTGRTKKLRAG